MSTLPQELERIIQNSSVIEIISDNPRRPVVSSTEMSYLYRQDDFNARLTRRVRTRRRTSTAQRDATPSAPSPYPGVSIKSLEAAAPSPLPLSPQKAKRGILRKRVLDRWEATISSSISTMLSLANPNGGGGGSGSSTGTREGTNDSVSQGPRIPVRRVSDETNKDTAPSGKPKPSSGCGSDSPPSAGSTPAMPVPSSACHKRLDNRRGSALGPLDRRGSNLDRRGSSTAVGTGSRRRGNRRGSVLRDGTDNDEGKEGERRVSVLQKVLSASEVIGRVIDELRLYDSDSDEEDDGGQDEVVELTEDVSDNEEETSHAELGLFVAAVESVDLEPR